MTGSGWKQLTEDTRGSVYSWSGDDLFVTNIKTLANADIRHEAANAILVKVNQIGTLT